MTERSDSTATSSDPPDGAPDVSKSRDVAVTGPRPEVPIPFKLRLGGAAPTPAAKPSEAVVASPVVSSPAVVASPVVSSPGHGASEWDSYPASIEQDALREYKADADMQSIIGQLASQIVDGEGPSSAPARLSAGSRPARPSGRVPVTPTPVPKSVPAAKPVPKLVPMSRIPIEVAPSAASPVAEQTVAEQTVAGRHVTTLVVTSPPDGRVEVPVIVEAAPQVSTSGAVAAISELVTGPVLASRPTLGTAPEVVAPQPVVIAPPLLPKIEPKPGASRPTKPVDFHALLSQSGLGQAHAKKHRKKRHPFRLLFKLVLLAGLVAGGAYAAKKYYFDLQWKQDLKPLAESVGQQRGLSWDHAVAVVDLDHNEYALKLAGSMLDVTSARATTLGSEWRAMGLAQGSIDLVAIGSAATADQPAFYDPVDAKIYEITGMSAGLREVSLTRALTNALLDQNFHWGAALLTADSGVQLGIRALFDGDALSIRSTAVGTVLSDPATAAAVSAELAILRADTAALGRGASPYAVALTGMPGDAARHLFTPGITPSGRDGIDALTVYSDASVFDGVRGRSVVPVIPQAATTTEVTVATTVAVISPTTLVDPAVAVVVTVPTATAPPTSAVPTGATVAGAATAGGPTPIGAAPIGAAARSVSSSRGMMYWYHVLAGRIPSDQAWHSVLAWNGDLVTAATTAAGQCIDANISTFDEAGQQALFAAMQQWAALAPIEAGTTVTSAGPTIVAVHSCDPGPGVTTYTNTDSAAFGQAGTELAVAAGMLSAGLPRTEAARTCVLSQVRFTGPPALVRSASVDSSLSEATLDLTSSAVHDLMAACATQ